MLMRPGPNTRRHALIISLPAVVLLMMTAQGVFAQSGAQSTSGDVAPIATELSKTTTEPSPGNKKLDTTEERLSALEQMLERQSQRLDQLQQTIAEQQETIRLLASKLNPEETPALRTSSLAADMSVQTKPAQSPAIEDRLKKVEARVSEIGAIKFSGDIRLRAESIFGQSNSLTNGDNPAVLGNDLSPRHRMRVRARLQMRGPINDEFDWGLRLATGSFADSISTNQTFTDFFNRKPFALDQAFITYKPKHAPGVRLQGGKFE